MSLERIKDYLLEINKDIPENKWFLKEDNKRNKQYLENAIKREDSYEKKISKLQSDLSDNRKEKEELKKTIAYLNKYISLKEEYDHEYTSYWGNCCSSCNGDCNIDFISSDEKQINLELKEKSLRYLETIINKGEKQ